MSSLAETANAIVADARKVADRVAHENRKYRHARGTAALIISQATNAPYSEETLRKSSCPYISVAGHVLYADDDLIALATDILARAQKRGSTTRPRLDPRPTPRLEGLAAQPNTKAGEQPAGFMNEPITAGLPTKLEGSEERGCEDEAR